MKSVTSLSLEDLAEAARDAGRRAARAAKDAGLEVATVERRKSSIAFSVREGPPSPSQLAAASRALASTVVTRSRVTEKRLKDFEPKSVSGRQSKSGRSAGRAHDDAD